MSLRLLSEKIFAVMETYEELTARWTKAVAEMEATVDEYQELEKEEAELVEQMTAHKAKLVELEAKYCQKDKDKTALKEHLKSLEKMAKKLRKMREDRVKRDDEAIEARSRKIIEKMLKTKDKEAENNADEETGDVSSTPTLVCTFLMCIFKVFLIMCWHRRRLPQTQGRWRRQRAPMKRTCSSLSRKRTTRRRRAGVVARGPGLPAGGTVPANGLQ